MDDMKAEGTVMDEIILSWPNVSLCYMDRSGSWGGLREFRELEKGQYSYRLTVGQQLQAIRYRGTNYDIFVQPTVVEIRPDGLVVTHLLQKNGEGLVFCPYRKELPSGGVYALRDLYIEPCEHLYEKNKLADILAGNVRDEDPRKPWEDGFRQRQGIFWKHGGWRTPGDHISQENLRNFVKMGQQELF